ncbi:hypothetical protein CYLTODRAFT_361014 [Cylindrobasidium torrendii FP15055 ss-10]|uniref:Uncharacterized protein n=1 Tax=Cylindrobasidium torrendii FP15055 ss-10 TaxID=1314674 RepID=A0A0D7AXY8_9AGAR|nr:hypothetical protein CYLTODRAFT_361014 [Cylindrobasidium torrendii FP15055 ss-10]
MPAISKLMRMKGHNGIYPCRACFIAGVRDDSPGNRSNTHYTPLFRNDSPYDPLDLPRRTHDQYVRQAIHVEEAPSDAAAKRRAREYGINGLSILASLSSISFPESFPHDFMHLGLENVIKTLISLWVGTFKGIDVGCEDYELPPSVIQAIGDACDQAGDTTPSSFGARVPNLATKHYEFIAETYLLFTTMLGPIVLQNRFKHQKYYNHFVDLVQLFLHCLVLSISRQTVEQDLRVGFAKWVEKYEQFVINYAC